MPVDSNGYYNYSDLLIAYRKAKADAYYERDHVSAAAFCDYEDNLEANLSKLLERLIDDQSFWCLSSPPPMATKLLLGVAKFQIEECGKITSPPPDNSRVDVHETAHRVKATSLSHRTSFTEIFPSSHRRASLALAPLSAGS